MSALASLPYPPIGLAAGRGPLMSILTRKRDLSDDRALAEALRDREEVAIEELYARHASSVLAYLTSTLGDRAAAEDVLQQVFAEVWHRAGQYDPERGSPFGWLMLIARSRALDELRRKRPEPQEPGVAADLADRAAEAEPDAALIERWQVAELLRRIPGEEAGMLKMRFYEGLSQREIAARTDVPLGTVKMRMVQAMDRMRVLMQEQEL